MEHPLKSIMENPQATEWIAKWAPELKPYGIKYESRTTIKRHLVDFIAEFTMGPSTLCNLLGGWVLNMDGASNSKGSRIRIVLRTSEGSMIEQSFTLGFLAINNEYNTKLSSPVSKWLRPSESQT